MRKILLIALCLMTGCSKSIPQPTVPLPADLASPCAALPHLEANDVDSLVEYTIEVIGAYNDCKAKQQDLAKAAS